jgi:hypothetical protein
MDYGTKESGFKKPAVYILSAKVTPNKGAASLFEMLVTI